MTQEERYKHYYNEGYNAGSVKGYEQAIKEACKWLLEWEAHQGEDIEVVEQFRKAMESSSSEFPNNCEKGEEDEDHFIDANKKVDRVIGTADHIKTALDVLNKKGGKK